MPWFTNRAGEQIRYEDTGSGIPLVFVHGWCMSSDIWKLQHDTLSDTFRVISIDLRGHGQLTEYPGGFSLTGCAEDLYDLVEQSGLEKPFLAGWSLGGMIAIEAYLMAQDRFSGLILVAATPQFIKGAGFEFGLSLSEAAGMGCKIRKNIGRALHGFVDLMFADAEKSLLPAIRSILDTVPIPPVSVATQGLEALEQIDQRHLLTMITCPTLVIHGDRDVVCLPEAAGYLADRIPRSILHMFPECGHAPFLTQSRQFNLVLAEFCRSTCDPCHA